MTDEITALIVDDHEVVREGLRLSLSRAPHIRVVGEAADGASAVELAERRKPDVVIMDVRMPGMDGLEATKLMTEKVPESKVLIFTAYSALASQPRPRERRQGVHPQGGAASDARACDREGRAGRRLRRPGADAGVPRRQGPDGDARRRGAGDPPAPRRRHVERGRRATALHLAGDGQEPRPPHPTKLEADTRTHAVAIALREAIID